VTVFFFFFFPSSSSSQGYSGADVSLICRDASLMSMRRAIEGKTPEAIRAMPKEQLELPITLSDFLSALAKTKPSVNPEDIKKFEEVRIEKKFICFVFGY
jgi:katanin p60 ATPase-containing subunit A1